MAKVKVAGGQPGWMGYPAAPPARVAASFHVILGELLLVAVVIVGLASIVFYVIDSHDSRVRSVTRHEQTWPYPRYPRIERVPVDRGPFDRQGWVCRDGRHGEVICWPSRSRWRQQPEWTPEWRFARGV